MNCHRPGNPKQSSVLREFYFIRRKMVSKINETISHVRSVLIKIKQEAWSSKLLGNVTVELRSE
jgi:hypothetical protein